MFSCRTKLKENNKSIFVCDQFFPFSNLSWAIIKEFRLNCLIESKKSKKVNSNST